MKTTVNINEELIDEAMSIYDIRTKKEIIELGLKELINSHKRKKLASLFGTEKKITKPPRRKLT